MEHHTTTSRAEAERLLGIAEKLLRNKDFVSSRDFAKLAKDTEPLLDGSDQILAVAKVLLVSEKRVNNHHDWYSILQIQNRTDDSELIKKQYRKFALLLHPDKNKFAFADSAFRLVSDAWNVLSDPSRKSAYDTEYSIFAKVDLTMRKQNQNQTPTKTAGGGEDFSQEKLPVRRSPRDRNANTNSSTIHNNSGGGQGSGPRGRRSNLGGNYSNNNSNSGLRGERRLNFWTTCPYCYNLYEYPRMYLGCCLKCQNCERAFTGIEVPSMPPRVPGKDAYYCCWGFFPMGFVAGDADGDDTADVGGFPNWMPPMFPGGGSGGGVGGSGGGGGGGGGCGNQGVGPSVQVDSARDKGSAPATVPKPGAKKRGRPRKNP